MILDFLHTILGPSEPFTCNFQRCFFSFCIDAISLEPVGDDLDASGLGAGLAISERNIKMGFIKRTVLIYLFGGDNLLKFADGFDFVLDLIAKFHMLEGLIKL